MYNPKYPQANGEAERAVQTIESLRIESVRRRFYYHNHSGKELPPLNKVEKATLQHGNKWVPVTLIRNTPRSYIVQTPEGQKY